MAREIGDYAELRFAAAAYENGFSVLRPFSDSRAYDVVLERHGSFTRVQVKSCRDAELPGSGSFHVITQKKSGAYTAKDCDIIAVYLISLDLFYLIPVRYIRVKSIRVYPDKNDHKYSRFKENWNI